MKILVASDNHRNEQSLEELIYLYEGQIDLWLHCGDSEFSSAHPLWKIFQTVNGNMDYRDEFPEYVVEKSENDTLLVVHGHKQRVGYSLDQLAALAKMQAATIVFYGHTHVAKVDRQEGIYFINPGSLTQPRGSLRKGSYAIYEKNKNEETITFYDWNHKKIEHLSQQLAKS